MLCPYGCDSLIVEGHGRDAGRYHCPRCQRCCGADAIAYAAFSRGVTLGVDVFKKAIGYEGAPSAPGCEHDFGAVFCWKCGAEQTDH